MEGRIYILNNKKLKEKILQENHNSGRCRIFRIVKNDGTTQTELFVARSKERCQEIHARLL